MDVADADLGRANDVIWQSQGIWIIQHYEVTECDAEPDRVVLEFLQLLSQI